MLIDHEQSFFSLEIAGMYVTPEERSKGSIAVETHSTQGRQLIYVPGGLSRLELLATMQIRGLKVHTKGGDLRHAVGLPYEGIRTEPGLLFIDENKPAEGVVSSCLSVEEVLYLVLVRNLREEGQVWPDPSQPLDIPCRNRAMYEEGYSILSYRPRKGWRTGAWYEGDWEGYLAGEKDQGWLRDGLPLTPCWSARASGGS